MQWQNGGDSRTVTFKYDPFGRRIEKQVVDLLSGSTVTKTVGYVYDGEDRVLQVEEVTADGTTTTTESRFVHGPGIDEPLALVRGGQSYFYHADGLGSVVALTDASQGIVQRYGYEGFGLPSPSDPDFEQPYAFTGREWDSEVGLYFYRARYFDPVEGRFISKDPIGFAGGDVNVYRYVGNNVSNLVDPFGLKCVKTAGKRVGEVGKERKMVGKMMARIQYLFESVLPQPGCKIGGVEQDVDVVPYEHIIDSMETGWRIYYVETSYYEMQQETYICETGNEYMEAYGNRLDKVYLHSETTHFKYNGPLSPDSMIIDGSEIFPYVQN